MIARILNFESKTVSKAAFLLAASALASRLLGILRDRLLAGTFGAGEDLDAYFAAFRIPDFLYAFLVIWGLSAVFLPLFSEYMEKSKEEAWRFVNGLLTSYAVLLGAGALAAFVFMEALVSFIAPGFEGSQFATAVSLSRLMLLGPFFFAFSAISAGALQYFQRFVAYAAAPLLYNLGIIAGIVFLAPFLGVFGVALGVVLGAAAHFLVQVPSLFAVGFSFKPGFSLFDEKLRRSFLLSLPRTAGGIAHQVNLMVMVAFASLLPLGSISIFTFAQNISYFPVGIIGIPLATAAFPMLSKAMARMDVAGFTSAVVSALKLASLLAVPAALALFLFRDLIFRLLFEVGEFTSRDVQLASSVFGVFTLGILFQSLIPLLVRAFFALQNTVVPTIAGILAVVLNIALAFLFLNLGWGIFALSWALVLSGVFQCLLLAVLLLISLTRSRNP